MLGYDGKEELVMVYMLDHRPILSRRSSDLRDRMGAAVEATNLKIKHDQTERVLDVLKNHVDGINGNIFHLRKIHWVTLVKVSGSDEAIYFDDMVMMYMKNYEGLLAA